jgi:hypothetical protein
MPKESKKKFIGDISVRHFNRITANLCQKNQDEIQIKAHAQRLLWEAQLTAGKFLIFMFKSHCLSKLTHVNN